jgi:cell division protein FtsQ
MMVPKVGDHVVELGDANDLDGKFANLVAFYRKGMPRAGWDTYSKISLKFKGQVVCTKK